MITKLLTAQAEVIEPSVLNEVIGSGFIVTTEVLVTNLNHLCLRIILKDFG